MTCRNEQNRAASTDDGSSPILALTLSGERLEAELPVRAARTRSTSSYGPADLSLESMVCLGVALTRRRRPKDALCL